MGSRRQESTVRVIGVRFKHDIEMANWHTAEK